MEHRGIFTTSTCNPQVERCKPPVGALCGPHAPVFSRRGQRMGCAMKKHTVFTLAVLASLCGVGVANAADLQRAPAYTKAPPPMAPAFTWTGFYIGLNAGGKWANVDQDITSGGTAFTLNGNNASSWIAGGQIGYNWQFNQIVLGIEGDIDAHDFSRSAVVGTAIGPFIPGDAFTVESHWRAAVG